MRFKVLAITLILIPGLCQAAQLPGAALSWEWSLPFLGLLLSIALGPLLMPNFWHRHYGKLAVAWSLAFLVPCGAVYGVDVAVVSAAEAFMHEFSPFIVLMTTLFVVAGGIYVRGNLNGTPALNTGLLAVGTLLASIMGTTGASMLLIRPLIRANDNRRHAAHVIVFFIFLVANAGGALTPLGDPPLFLGFLKGVDFFWPLKNIFPETLFLCATLLAIFYLLDTSYYHRREETLPPSMDPTPDSGIQIEGKGNFILFAVIIALVLMSGIWKPNMTLYAFGVGVELQNLTRDALLIGVLFISLSMTSKEARKGNEFTWGPIVEVAKLFAAIFITIIPVIAILRAGSEGVFALVLHAVTEQSGRPNNVMYFWITGLLSSFLDNAPTYLVFFNAAGGDPKALMTTLAPTLAAISVGAVMMGANSYIGNAPNLMIRAIAEERHIKMPSFFGYMAWSCAVLIPLFIVMSFLFFR